MTHIKAWEPGQKVTKVGGNMSTTIRFQTFETQPFILLPAQVNGKGPFDFVLDTGASMSIMTEELANVIGIEGTEIKEGLGSAGRKLEVSLGKVDSISFGEIRVKDVRVGIKKTPPLEKGRRYCLISHRP